MSKTILLDSSCWIEIFNQGKHSNTCENEKKKADVVIVPTLVLYEVYRKILLLSSEDKALLAISVMNHNQVEDMTQEIALTAADISTEHNLAMADSIILAHSKLSRAKLITLDNDFAQIPDVKVIR